MSFLKQTISAVKELPAHEFAYITLLAYTLNHQLWNLTVICIVLQLLVRSASSNILARFFFLALPVFST